MDVQVKDEELDDSVKVEEVDDPVKREGVDVPVKTEEEEVPSLPSRPSSKMRSALSVAASNTASQPRRSFSNLVKKQTAARPARLAARNNASAVIPSTAPATLPGRHGPAHASLPASSSAPMLSTTTAAPAPKGSGARQSARTKLRSATTKSKPVFRDQPVSSSGPNLIPDASVALSFPPSQPSQHMQGERRPVSPTKTTKLVTGLGHHETAMPFCKETRTRLDNKPHEDWTYTTSTGCIKKLPQLGGCGSWEVSLPSKMDTAIHIDPYIGRLCGLLNVQVESTKSPPSIHVKLFESQLAEQAKHAYLLEEHTAMKWKAWALLSAWADHLVRRGAPPAIPPIDLVSFVRNKLLAEGRHAKANAVSLLQERQGVTLLPEGLHTSQMPRLTPADLLPKSEPSLPQAQQRNPISARRLPQTYKTGHKRMLNDDSSSSSSSESSPEAQAKRLCRKK